MKNHVLYYKCNKEKESPGISRGFILSKKMQNIACYI